MDHMAQHDSPSNGQGQLGHCLANRAEPKNEGPLGEKYFTEIEKQLSIERWGCGNTRTVDSGPRCAQS